MIRCRVPERHEPVAIILAPRRRHKLPTIALPRIEAGRFEKRGKQAPFGGKPFYAEPLLAVVEHHALEQFVLRSNGVARRLLAVQQFVVKPWALLEPLVREFGGETVQISLSIGLRLPLPF